MTIMTELLAAAIGLALGFLLGVFAAARPAGEIAEPMEFRDPPP